MGADLTTETLHPVTYQDTARDHAVLYVCARAHNSDDARLLLDALGLNGRPIRGKQRQDRKHGTCQRCRQWREIRAYGMCWPCRERDREGEHG